LLQLRSCQQVVPNLLTTCYKQCEYILLTTCWQTCWQTCYKMWDFCVCTREACKHVFYTLLECFLKYCIICRKYIYQFLLEPLKVIQLCSVFVAIFYVFGIALGIFFSVFFSPLFCTLLPKTCQDKNINSTNAKPVNFTIFTRRTIDKIALFLWYIPSCFLINFVF
jgi:hypothetical protein